MVVSFPKSAWIWENTKPEAGQGDVGSRPASRSLDRHIGAGNLAMLTRHRVPGGCRGSVCSPWNRSRPGEGITRNAYKLAWARARVKAGLPDLRSHDTGRSAVQNLRRLDVDRAVRKAQVGHSDDATHDKYDGASDPELKEAGRKVAAHLAPLFGTLAGTIEDEKSSSTS